MKRIYEVSLDGHTWAGVSLNAIVKAINETLKDPKDFLKQTSLCELANGKRQCKYSKGAQVKCILSEDYSPPEGAVWVPRGQASEVKKMYAVRHEKVWYVGPVLSHVTNHINNGIDDPRDHLKLQSLSSLSTGNYSGKTHKGAHCMKIVDGQDIPVGAVFISC